MPAQTEWIAIAVGIIIILIICLAVFTSRARASLRRQATELNGAWLEIDRLLKRRSDDLPRLVQICRSYMPPQESSLRSVGLARTAYVSARTIREKALREADLRKAVSALFADAERYPDLQMNSTFSSLHADFLEVGERIDDRRELFRDDAARFNSRLQHPPSSWIAARMNLRPQEPFDPPEERPRS